MPAAEFLRVVAVMVAYGPGPFDLTDAVTYALFVVAIIITGVVLIQGYRDTAAMRSLMKSSLEWRRPGMMSSDLGMPTRKRLS